MRDTEAARTAVLTDPAEAVRTTLKKDFRGRWTGAAASGETRLPQSATRSLADRDGRWADAQPVMRALPADAVRISTALATRAAAVLFSFRAAAFPTGTRLVRGALDIAGAAVIGVALQRTAYAGTLTIAPARWAFAPTSYT